MIDWLEEVLKEGEPELLLPPVERNSYAFRRAEVLTDGEENSVPEQAGGMAGEDSAGMAEFARLGEESPLRSLYRRVGETLSGSAFSVPARREIVVREGTESRPGLTVRELDLAVRRDSRRYDGGMSIY